MCILLYVKLIWCSGFPQIYGQLEEDLLYFKLMQCCGIPEIYGQLDDGTSYISVHFRLKK